MEAQTEFNNKQGVWAAEGFENSRSFFDPSELLRLHHFEVGHGPGTSETSISTDFYYGAQTPSK